MMLAQQAVSIFRPLAEDLGRRDCLRYKRNDPLQIVDVVSWVGSVVLLGSGV
jgi:hypothetical protein